MNSHPSPFCLFPRVQEQVLDGTTSALGFLKSNPEGIDRIAISMSICPDQHAVEKYEYNTLDEAHMG